ncbi:MAG TPA: tetratricopeptide repeat protein [Bryobacteraceae bacterium]|jgi:tetratricopeptide (TPR) repeat protein|nr:tetratricopeptide repeat protein [Bryobacteraceae bacterium]
MIGNFGSRALGARCLNVVALSALGFSFLLVPRPGFSQTPAPQAPVGPAADHSNAYYEFAMAHLYAELAGAYGNRGEYVNKAIDFYRQAIKADPSATYIAVELAEFYVQAGQLDRAMQEANDLLKANPNNNDARKILGRIYARQIDPDQGRVDQTMLKNAIDQYEKITQTDPKDGESLSMLARLYRVAKNDVAAEKAYRAVLQDDPNDDEALNGLAMIYVDRGDVPNAIAMLEQAVEKNPDQRNVQMLGEFYEQIKDFGKAADTFKQALALTNDTQQLRVRIALDLLNAGRLDEALAAFQELATDQPKNVLLQIQVAEILERKHDYAGAAAVLAKAHTVETKDSALQIRFAEEELLRVQGKTQQAIVAMQSLLADTKKDKYADQEKKDRIRNLYILGAMHEDASKTADAIADYRQIAELDPALAPSVEGKVVEAYKNAKDFKGARQAADASIRKYPAEKPLIFEHALLLADLGSTDQAVNELKAIPSSAKDRDTLITLAQVQDKGKRFEDERKTLDAAEAQAESAQDKQTVEFMRGAMYEREKNFDAAEKAFRNVLEADPQNAGAMNYLGYMYADRNIRLEEAQQLISKALDIEPDNGAYEDSLGWVYYRLNKLDQAADELRMAIDKVGKDPTVHEHLGDVYARQGKIREAIQQWESSVSEWKVAAPSEQDPVELAKVTKKLEGAKVKVAEKTR